MRIFARLFAILCAITFVSAPSFAQLKVTVTQGNVKPIIIAVPDFQAMSTGVSEAGDAATLGRQMAQVIAADLASSGLFKPVDQRAYIGKATGLNDRPTFSNWRAIETEAVVSGGVWIEPNGTVSAAFRLWDVFAETQLEGNKWSPTRSDSWRRIAHQMADAIYKRLTGEDGYFDTRVVFVSETGPKTKRVKALAMMDQDGYGFRKLTNGKDLVLTPRFSPNQQKITYLSYFNDKPRVYLYDIASGRHEVLGDFPNMTFAPRFSPDGNKIIMSLSSGGNSEIYTMDLATRQLVRLTFSPGIDTSPSYSPDGKQIVFNSDRGGSQQLYVMNADGSNPHRISFGKGKYGTPVWSPRGDLIAFTKIGGGFAIGVMKPDGSGERMLTNGYQDEGPTWAPNGRVIMYFRTERYRGAQKGEVSLWSVDLTGYNERLIKTPEDGSDPAWSPLLQ